MNRVKDRTGQTFNGLRCIKSDTGKRSWAGRHSQVVGLWYCLYCGAKKELVNSKVANGQIKSCGCLNHRKGKHNHGFTGYEEISGHCLGHIKQGAKERGICYEVSEKYLWNLFLAQNRKCALSGDSIWFSNWQTASQQTASLDRIDSSKGYVEGNVQWLHKDVNVAKQDKSDEEFVEMCKKVARHNKES